MLVERIHVLVDTTDGHASLVFFDWQQAFDGPHSLDGFPERFWFVRRHAGVDAADLEQLCLALWIALLRSELCGVIRETLGVDHHTLGGVDDGFIEINFFQIVWIFVVELRQMVARFLLNVEHPFLHQDDVVARIGIAAAIDGVVRAVGNHRFTGERPDACFAVLGLAVFVDRFSFPEWEQLFAHDALVFLGNVERILRTLADGVDLVDHPAPGDVWRKSTDARSAGRVADDELVILDDERRRFAAIAETLGAQLDLWQTRIFLSDLRDCTRTVGGDGRHLLEEVLFQFNKTLRRPERHTILVHLAGGSGNGRIIRQLFAVVCVCGYRRAGWHLSNFVRQRGDKRH